MSSHATLTFALLLIVVVTLVFSASSALAKEVHNYSFSFGSAGSGAGQLEDPTGVAVNNATGNVYVADKGNNRIDEFESNGTFIRAWGWGVADGLPKFETCTIVCQVGSEGSGAGEVSFPESIAVDNSGSASDPSKEDVYVANPGNGAVEKFSSTGAYLYQITEAAGQSFGPGNRTSCGRTYSTYDVLCGVAVGANGELWFDRVGEGGPTQVFNFSNALENKYVALRGAGQVGNSALAVDSAENYYVPVFDDGNNLREFDSDGKQLVEEFSPYGGTTGVAFDPLLDTFFVKRRETGSDGVSASVLELSAEGSLLETFGEANFTIESAAGSATGTGIAVNYSTGTASSGTVYATDAYGDYVAVFGADTVPDVAVEPVSSFTETSATLPGSVNPENSAITHCEFEYGTEPNVFSHKVECSQSLPLGGDQPVAVSATAAGLTHGDTYYYRLVTTSAAGVIASSERTFIMPDTVTIGGESVPFDEPTAATLAAEINPGGSGAAYHFEYGPAKGSYDVRVPIPDADIAATLTDVRVSVRITGLTPGTSYHYRVVASNALPGEVDGPDEVFTTPNAPSSAPESCPNAQARAEQPYGLTLPDCRAYELVSPLDKNDRGAEAIDSRASVSDEPSGSEASAIAYLATGSFSEVGQPEPQGANKVNRYVSRRNATGWSTQSVTPSSVAFTSGGNGTGAFGELFFTPTLSEGVVQSEFVPLVEGEPAGYFNLYVANLATSPVSYQTVTNISPGGATYAQTENQQSAAGASTDLSHVVFQQNANLTKGAGGKGCRASGCEHVYEWAAGKLSQVDISPAGAQFEYSDQVGAPGRGIASQDTWHAVSANGLRVFFTAGESTQNPEEGQLYVRENAASPTEDCAVAGDACTVEVSKSQKTNGGDHALQPAYYRDANAAGTRVFFTSRAELTNDANTGEKDNAANLYEYNLETRVLSDLTVNAESNGAEVLGLVDAGENVGEENSYLYFVANGVLAHNENADNETAKPGSCREEEGESQTGENTCGLYVAHYIGGKWETKFVAMLVDGHTASGLFGDEPDWDAYEGGTLTQDFGPGRHTARVTPDGTTLAFQSGRSLTGYNNEPVEPGECTENETPLTIENPAVACREVYLYNAVTEKLVCASCDPSGALPVGPAELQDNSEEGNVDASPSTFYRSRNLSEDGKRLFFQSLDPLVPHDSNGQLNVYEWEQLASPAEAAKGENSCTSSSPGFSASDGGCVLPISDVAGDFESRFMDASASGSNVFIATKDQLVPAADADSRQNVYDVRVGGGFPVSVLSPVCDNADSCKPPASPQPGVFAAPASATFSGPGNPAPYVAPPPPPPKKTTTKAVKCKKDFVKKKVKKKETCVKKKSKKSTPKSAKGRK